MSKPVYTTDIPEDYRLLYFIRLGSGPYFRACFVPRNYDVIPEEWSQVIWRDLLRVDVSPRTTTLVGKLESQLAFCMSVEFRADQVDGISVGNGVRSTYKDPRYACCWFLGFLFKICGGMTFRDFVLTMQEDPSFQIFQTQEERKLVQLSSRL